MYQKILHLMYKLEQNKVFTSIKAGLIFLIPILVIGSMALAIKNFPIPAFATFLEQALNGCLAEILDLIYDSTLGLMSVYLSCAVTYCYASTFHNADNDFQIMAVITSLGCFLISFGAPLGAFRFADFGALGIASAIFCALMAATLLNWFSQWRLFRFSSYADGADRQFYSVISMIFPMMLVLGIFALFTKAVQLSTGEQNLNYFLSNLMVHLFQNISGELSRGILFAFLLNALWFFGMHGGNIMEPVAQSFFAEALKDPEKIINKSFLDSFAFLGGSGTAFCLLLALFFFARNQNSRKLAWSAVPFSVFNMNELLVFGLPVILNPALLIPFLLTPVLSLCIAYFATVIGFLPVVHETVVWSTPVLFSGYAAVGSYRGVVVQIVILVAGTLFYAPFIRFAEKLQANYEQILLDDFSSVFWKEYNTAEAEPYLGRSDRVGIMAKRLALRLKKDIMNQQITVCFQPQFDAQRQIVGAETLLRWKYRGMPVAPPIVCQIAKEEGLFDQLTFEVIKLAIENMEEFKKHTGDSFSLSVNVTAGQVSGRDFVDKVLSMLELAGIKEGFCLELVEDDSMENHDNIIEHLRIFREAGVEAAIDDFSMGATSIKYLQEDGFKYVKLDGELVKHLMDNERSLEIVRSIISLGNDLGFEVIAEYVESEALFQILYDADCRIFQGYLCSPAVPAEQFVEIQTRGFGDS